MRVISRAGAVVALLLIVMFMLYMMLLGTRALGAQETMMEETTMMGDTMMEETTNGDDEGCDNPQEIESFSGTENQLTDEFTITGNTFRIRVDVEETDPGEGFPTLDVDVLDESGDAIGQGILTFEEDDSENILAGPGTFSLDIRAEDLEYAIEVDDCRAASNDGEDTDDGVIDDTIPNKPLPDTGGSTALMVGGSALLLLYGSLVAWRLKTRER